MRILLLTSSSGGTHTLRAHSFEKWNQQLEAERFGFEKEVLHALEDTHAIYAFGLDIYKWVQQTLPSLHHIYFNYLDLVGMHRSSDRIVGKKTFQREVARRKPDVIVSVHSHLNHGFFDLAREVLGKDKITCVTYCGELYGGYGFSRHWVNPKADLFIGAVEETCAEAKKLGMPDEKNFLGGFMLHPSFFATRMKKAEKEKFVREVLKLDPSEFILVLGTSQIGSSNQLPFLEALYNAEFYPQIVVLCEKDLKVKQAVEHWSQEHRKMKVTALPYFNRMSELMQSVSAFVTRPSALTTSEAIMSECPIIFNGIGGTLPQEALAIKYAAAHDFDHIVRSTSALPTIIEEWMQQRGNLLQVKECLRRAQPHRHPLDILERLEKLEGDEEDELEVDPIEDSLDQDQVPDDDFDDPDMEAEVDLLDDDFDSDLESKTDPDER